MATNAPQSLFRAGQGWRARYRERGQIVVFAAALAPVILGLTGLAVDFGFAAHQRGKAANAADAAALAGADVLLNGGTVDQAETASLTYAENNGYQKSEITVQIPPLTGPHAGMDGFVAVRISHQQPTIFMRALLVDSVHISARAVAGYLTSPKNYALVVLDKTACSAYTQSSNSTLTINDGGMLVNSSRNPSATQSGGSTVTGEYLDYYDQGGWQLNNNATTSPPPEPVLQQIADPLAGLPRPVPCTSTTTYTPPGCNVLQSTDSAGTQASPKQTHISVNSNSPSTLHPGVYWGGLKIDGNGGGTVTFLPGTYIFAGGGSNSGGFTYTGTADLSGSGVTFYNTDDPQATSSSNQPCGAYSLSGGGTLSFTAPTSGTWQNMLFWQSDSCNQTFTYSGGPNTTAGVIYLPTAQLSVSGGGNLGAMQIIVDTFTYSGSAPLTINYTDYVTIQPPWLALVE